MARVPPGHANPDSRARLRASSAAGQPPRELGQSWPGPAPSLPSLNEATAPPQLALGKASTPKPGFSDQVTQTGACTDPAHQRRGSVCSFLSQPRNAFSLRTALLRLLSRGCSHTPLRRTLLASKED